MGEDNHLRMVRCQTVGFIEKHEGEVIGQLMMHITEEMQPLSFEILSFEIPSFDFSESRLRLVTGYCALTGYCHMPHQRRDSCGHVTARGALIRLAANHTIE